MPQKLNMPERVVTGDLQATAQEVVDAVRRNTSFPYLMDAKLGDAENEPMMDIDTAARNDTPFYTIAIKWKDITHDLIETDRQHGNPLCQIARRANDVIARAAITNRHNRRPPLYAETTIREFIKLELSTPEHSPLIRAAGHVTPPPIFPLNHDLTPVVRDIAAHMAGSVKPQNAAQILRSLEDRQGLFDKWPKLDLALFIRRTTGIGPDDQGLYHPDQPWGQLLSPQRLVTNTVLRIFKRDQEPHTMAHLVTETERLAGQFLPAEYNTRAAVRATVSKSDEISWQGRSTYGLREWDTPLDTRNTGNTRASTGDVTYAFLMEHGPTDIENLIKHVQRTASVQRRTVQEAMNHDPAHRFIWLPEQRMAANPAPQGHNPNAPPLTVVPDEHSQPPASVLRESEFAWLTRYVQELNELTPPLPTRAALTGPRAAGFASGDPMEIVVVVDDQHRASLKGRLAQAAEVASESVPSVQPQISIVPPERWAERMEGETPEAHHNIWLAPDTVSRQGDA